MAKILVAYVSMSGNTEAIANLLKNQLSESSHEVVLADLTALQPSDLVEYDGIAIGSYTFGDGELPDEALDFYEGLDEVDLSGKKAAAFGSGDTSYPDFCHAVSLLEGKLKACGAAIVAKGLKVEYAPDTDEALANIQTFTQEFLDSL